MSFKVVKYANVTGDNTYDQIEGHILENVFMKRVSGTGTVNITQGLPFAYNKEIQAETYLNGFTGDDAQVVLEITGSAICDVMLQYTKIDTETFENLEGVTTITLADTALVQLVKIEHVSGVGLVTVLQHDDYICYQQPDEGSFRGNAGEIEDYLDVTITGTLIVNITILSNNFTA